MRVYLGTGFLLFVQQTTLLVAKIGSSRRQAISIAAQAIQISSVVKHDEALKVS